jgi:FAD synthetase
MSETDLEIKFKKYSENLEKVFSQIGLTKNKNEKNVNYIVDLAKRYFDDARYFKEKGQMMTAIISLAYCEGLLDALRLLNLVKFEWRVK